MRMGTTTIGLEAVLDRVRAIASTAKCGAGLDTDSEHARIASERIADGYNPFKITDVQHRALKAQCVASLVRNGRKLAEAMSDVASLFLIYVQANFASGTGSKPLSPRYAAWKSKAFPGQPPMVRTGGLMRSLMAKVIRG